jgi:ornithine lipid ester-linked acyl 2-hydroxylase
MDDAMEEIYFTFESNTPYKLPENSPPFYDSANFEWAQLIEQKSEVIRAEILDFVTTNNHLFKGYFDKNLVKSDQSWRQAGFYFWGLSNKRVIESCPKTAQLMKSIPNMVSASISILGADSEIKGHNGDTNAIYRCHLPIVVPEGLPNVGFQVEKEQRPWETGKLLIFNDAAYHCAWNHSSDRRIILVFDVIREEYAVQSKFICAKVLSIIGTNATVQRWSRYKVVGRLFQKIFFLGLRTKFVFKYL